MGLSKVDLKQKRSQESPFLFFSGFDKRTEKVSFFVPDPIGTETEVGSCQQICKG